MKYQIGKKYLCRGGKVVECINLYSSAVAFDDGINRNFSGFVQNNVCSSLDVVGELNDATSIQGFGTYAVCSMPNNNLFQNVWILQLKDHVPIVIHADRFLLRDQVVDLYCNKMDINPSHVKSCEIASCLSILIAQIQL